MYSLGYEAIRGFCENNDASTILEVHRVYKTNNLYHVSLEDFGLPLNLACA